MLETAGAILLLRLLFFSSSSSFVVVVIFVFLRLILMVVGTHASYTLHDVTVDPGQVILFQVRGVELLVGVVIQLEVEIESDPRIEPRVSVVGDQSGAVRPSQYASPSDRVGEW